MRNRVKFGLAAIAAIVLASPATAAWKAGDRLYDTLGACFADGNYSCRFVGRLVKVDDPASLARAKAALRASRRASSDDILYYLVDRGEAPRRSIVGGPRITETGADIWVAGCLTASGDVHKPPCGGKDVRISVEE